LILGAFIACALAGAAHGQAWILEGVGVGNAVSLTVLRDGRSRSLDVTVTDISKQAQE
jgi:S1-C subfamily serine protease